MKKFLPPKIRGVIRVLGFLLILWWHILRWKIKGPPRK